ncbi:hypothetical protein EMPG_14707 [Blastomyces silverae]|uniref:Nucleolar protein Dnt1-like N-terminal domain-containing protein n=1 Tax=Blastomyces silverae TaxID=2060906 RepID=A0A0H1BFT4_9EURO|nr:hypothetical protein EMPG_14707 [Blastomyces silverae]
MVLLRLTVKVYPREQLGQSSTPDQAGDNDDRKSINFLLLVHHPEQVMLGNLAHMIREKWMTLKPEAGPLEIKKLVDDKHPEDTIDAALTAADVFVDNGKALADGLDQRGAVRVIQQPGRPERYGSVVQDWTGIASNFARPAPPLFSDQPRQRHEDRPVHTEFTGGPVAGPSHAAQVPESDYAPQSSEIGEERSGRHDNHTNASPILVEDSQKPRIFASSAGKSLDLRNYERTTSKEPSGSAMAAQEEDKGYGGTIHDAMEYTNAKDEAAMREIKRQELLRASMPPPRTSAPPQSSLPSHRLRSTSSTHGNSNTATPNKREAEAVDIYTIPSASQEEFKKPQKPRSTKRQRRNISRADEFTVKNNMETLLASPGDRANNAIIVDSDIGEDRPTNQAQSPRDDNVAADNPLGIRRGTRKSNIRGPGRMSMALKLAISPPANAKTSTPGSTRTTKTPAKNKVSLVIADSDIEIVDPPQQHTEKTSGGRGGASQPRGNVVDGGNNDEGDRNAPTGANGTHSTKRGSTQRSNAYQLEHVDAEDSNPIYSDISDSDIPDDAGAPSSGAQKNTQAATPQKTPQKLAPSPAERRQTPGSGSAPYLPTNNSFGTLELTTDPDNIPERPSHSSPNRPRDAQELELGITSPPPKHSRTPSMSQPVVATDTTGNSRRGVSSTPAFPRPRRGSQSQTERRGSLLESEKSSTGPRTPVMSALRSAQKSTPRTVSTRRSVSFVDDPKTDSQPTPSSASSVKIGNTMYPPGTTVEWVEWQYTDGKLQKRIDEARLQGKSEDYCALLEEIKHFTEKLYGANSKKIGYKITKYERKLKKAKESLQGHPEEDHHAESSSGDGQLENSHSREDENGGKSENHTDAMGTPKGTRKKLQHQIGLDGASKEGSQDEKSHAKQPSDAPASRDSLVSPSLETPSPGNFVVAITPSPGGMGNGTSGKNAEEAKTFKDGNGLKRKRPESGTVKSPDNTKRVRSDYKPHPVEPEGEPNNMNANSSEQKPSKEPERRNGKSPARDPMSSSDSSSSDSDSDSESDSNFTPANGKVKRPSLPPPGGAARRALITPFRNINKTWPNKGAQWLSDEPENTHTTTAPTRAAVGFGAPTSFSQPAPGGTGTGGASGLRTSRMTMNGGGRVTQRDTLKTLLERQKGSEDESSAKNMSASENGDSAQGGDGNGGTGFRGFNGLLRRAGFR